MAALTHNIRPFRADDRHWAFDLAAGLGLSPWTEDDYLLEIGHEDSLMLIAEIGTQRLGFIIGRCVPRSVAGGGLDAEIYNIGVEPELQRSGIGSRLIEHFLNGCRVKGVKEVWLEVRAQNAAARAFYTGFGFTEFSLRPGFYSAPADDAVVMRLELRSSNFSLT